MEGTMAVVSIVAYDFAPKYWASCNGQTLAIAQNQALFSLLGTTYGGNGINTFALPDMRGRVQVSPGISTTGTNYTLGEMTGTENVSLSINNLPPHNHNGTVNMTPRAGTGNDDLTPIGNYPGTLDNGYATSATPATFMNGPHIVSTTIGASGSSMPFSVLTPYLALNHVICMYGIFPSRN